MNIHFICRGNLLRSLVAETYLTSLQLSDVNVISSGTNVNWDDAAERSYFADTCNLLKMHGIETYAKTQPEQLTQLRANNQDITICMNQRVINEAKMLITLPPDTINWHIIDIGEGNRTAADKKSQYLEEIYQEVTEKVDELVADLNLQ